MVGKKFKDLDLKNAFLFAATLQDPETCQLILEMILGRPVSKVNVHVEHSLLYSSDFRSVRLDVYAADEMEVTYNLEMQNGEKKELPKRSRYHQAEMDVSALKPGGKFTDLKQSYVIFICTYDPFGYGLYRYTFENLCQERRFPLGDETCKIFLNTKGTNDSEVPELLVDFLHYVENSSDEYVEQVSNHKIGLLHNKVCKVKKSREWEAQYMTFEELLQDSERNGKEKGIQEERQRLLKLIKQMLSSEDAGLIADITKDEALLEQMYEKYHL